MSATTNRGRGRPKLADPRVSRSVRWHASEYDRIVAYARRQGMSTSDAIRSLVLRALGGAK